MKRLQNPRMVDGDYKTNMEDMEHQGENENHVLTTMENNPMRKEKIKKMLMLAIHESLTKIIIIIII
jgi:hypothetical protein